MARGSPLRQSRDSTRLIERRHSGASSQPGGRADAGERPKYKQGRCSAGQCVAVTIFLVGLSSIFAVESFKLLQTAGGIRSVQGESSFCPMPPKFGPSEDEVFGTLRKYPKFDLRTPMVRKYARLIHSYLEPWYPVKGATKGFGSKGIISPEALKGLAVQPAVMSCNGHIKVSNGKVYFRYGGFWHVYYRLHRFLQTVKMVQDAVEQFGLTDLHLEMFVNTCDHPQSFYSSHWPDRAGYPIMSTGFTVDTNDIPVPDPLDLTPDYTPDLSKQIPWNRKFTRAVFRGKTTNFDMFDGNWGANPRVRLHRMSDTKEGAELMDAHINSWSHANDAVQKSMAADGLHLAQRMNFTQFNAFKYQVIVDGGGGSCRTCGVLRSNQMSFRQRTPLLQFYEPLVEDNVHWLVVSRTFDDLLDRIRWAQHNDQSAQRLVEAANEFATYGCTLRGRTLYWALMLVKYQEAIMDTEKISIPTEICPDKATIQSPAHVPNPASVRCDDPAKDKKQTASCAWFCASGIIPEDRLIWLRADQHLKGYSGVGPL